MNMKRSQRMATALAGALLASVTAIPAHAQAPAVTSTRSAPCGPYVLASVPLIDEATGVTLPYNSGFVQLWYNSCNGYSYAHVLSYLPGTTSIRPVSTRPS